MRSVRVRVRWAVYRNSAATDDLSLVVSGLQRTGRVREALAHGLTRLAAGREGSREQ